MANCFAIQKRKDIIFVRSIMASFRIKLQLAEALGASNRYFCSKAYGKIVDDEETLFAFFIKSGGANDFCRRFDEAMSETNRWYCSEYYGQSIEDPETLWEFYERNHALPPPDSIEVQIDPGDADESDITKLFDALSALHIAQGGLGLEFAPAGNSTFALKEVS